MKKYAAFLIAIIILCFIGGCQINNSSEDTPKIDFKNTGILQDELFEKQTDDMNIKIRYPQIRNSENFMTEKVNKTIKDVATNKYLRQWVLKGLTVDQSYEIEMHSNELLSVVFYQYAYVAETAHPNNSCFAVTINLKTAKKFSLSDVRESYEHLENSISSDNYEILYGGLAILNKDEIIKFIRSEFENVSFDENKDHFFISKDGSTCIIIDLPQSAGGYSVIKIKLR